MASKKIKRKDPYYYKLDKYECWWEDHASSCEWKDIKEASKDTCEGEGLFFAISKTIALFSRTIAVL